MGVVNEDHFTLLLVRQSDGGEVTCGFEQTALKEDPKYDILTYMDGNTSEMTTLEIDGQEFEIPASLKHALRQLTLGQEERRLWIDHLCETKRIKYSDGEEEKKKTIHKKARHVYIWIGNDHEPEDLLDGYLGKGTPESTDWAFGFANTMKKQHDAGDMDENMKLQSALGKPAWCYLARLVYRRWYRELPLLRTNYHGALSKTVMCGAASIPWYDLWSAIDRVRDLEPVPHFIEGVETNIQFPVKTTDNLFPGMTVEECIRWVRAREKLGLNNLNLFAKLILLIDDGRKAGFPQSLHLTQLLWLRRLIHLLSPVRGSRNDKLKYWLKKAKEEREDPVAYADRNFPFQTDLPTLSYATSTYPPPKPEHQAVFVHAEIDGEMQMRLLVLLPHQGDPKAPIQCEMVHVLKDSPPPFTYVDNGSLTWYKQNGKNILVNNQSYYVSRPLEVLLRHMRHERLKVPLFHWKTCTDREEGNLSQPDGLSRYFASKSSFQAKSSGTIDMHVELKNVSQDVGDWPDGQTRDEWLLNLTEKHEEKGYYEVPWHCPVIDWSRPIAKRFRL